MNEFDQIYERWRRKLLQTNIYMAAFVFLMEVLMYFVLGRMNLIEQPIPVYVTWFLIIPTFLNAFILIIGNVIINIISIKSRFINYIPIIQMVLLCLVIAGIHNIFSVTLCIISFPIYATIVFSDKRMTRVVGALCLCDLIIVLVLRKVLFFHPKNDRYFLAETIVAASVLASSFIVSNVLITFTKEKTNIILQSHIHEKELQERINRDQMTGLLGQTVFMKILKDMTENAKRLNGNFALAIIDIDDFKKVNDSYGHLKGDQIIVHFGNLMKEFFNEEQYIARYGGEEFAVILSGDRMYKDIELLEKLRLAFENQNYSFTEEKITISIGIAVWREGWTSEQLFEAADTAMYASKSEGKNKITDYELLQLC